MSNKIWVKIRIHNRDDEREGPVLPKRVNRRWPAIILAASRIARVPGRIIFLIVSISTIKGIRAKGVPCGTKWENICFLWLNQPKIINVNQRGKDKAKVMLIWLDLVNTYGKRPKKLLNTINLNRAMNNIEDPRCEGWRRALNSLWRVEINFLHRRDHREGEDQ